MNPIGSRAPCWRSRGRRLEDIDVVVCVEGAALAGAAGDGAGGVSAEPLQQVVGVSTVPASLAPGEPITEPTGEGVFKATDTSIGIMYTKSVL